MADNAFKAIKAILSSPSSAPDGLTATEALAPSESSVKQVSLVRDVLGEFLSGRIIKDAATALQLVNSVIPVGKPIDDKKLLMEHLIATMAAMDPDSPVRASGSDQFLKLLWNDLPHPVTCMLGPEHVFRKADGSNNNLFLPSLGASGSPYARTVPPLHPKPTNLPDPGLIFDCLLKRDNFVEQPSGVSSMMFAFAVLIVHTIFRTEYDDPFTNSTSSYLDLSVLYGRHLDEQKTVRVDKAAPEFGYGMLKPDCCAESRLFMMPPQVTALLVLFSRHHNYCAQMLYKVNEQGAYSDPTKLSPEKREAQDETIFQYARNINSALFIQIILHDYVNSILGLNRTKTDFFLDAGKEIDGALSGRVDRALGNVCSAEFNILYRWHATLSQKDEAWTNAAMQTLCGKPFDQIQPMEFVKAATKLAENMTDPKKGGGDPLKWEIPGLKRNPTTHMFADDDLARVITEAIDAPAGAFRARGIPAVMKPIDVLGMMAARRYNVCTLNEFRAYFNLKTYESFEEWAGDKEVAKVAEKLYVHIDNLELYPGLLAECPKPGKMVGSGLAPGYTISSAILSDAVALVRGDRFYSTDYNSTTLTSWGLEYLSSSQNDGAKGGMLKKLLLRTLPENFQFNSTYVCFPFQTPVSANEIMKAQGIADKYDFSPPRKAPNWKEIHTYDAANRVLSDSLKFGVIYSGPMQQLSMDGYGFMLGFDQKQKHDDDRAMVSAAVFPTGFEDEYKKFYTKITQKLLKENSWRTPGTNTYNCDIVRDVTRMASVYWAATYFGIPLKTKESPHGIMTPQEFYFATAAMFIWVFMDFDPVESFKLKDAALQCGKMLSKIIEARIHEVRGFSGFLENLLKGPASLVKPGPEATALYKRLLATGRPINAMVSSCLGMLIASSQNQGQAAAQTLNLYLEPRFQKEKEELVALAQQTGTKADELMLRYCYEAQRLDPQTPGIPRFARESARVKDGDKIVDIQQGDRIFVSLVDGFMDPAVFPEPEKIKLDRPVDKYRLFGWGSHTCLGAALVDIAQPIMLRETMRLKNLRRAHGKQGRLNRFDQNFHGVPIHLNVTATSTFFPFPQSMSVAWEE